METGTRVRIKDTSSMGGWRGLTAVVSESDALPRQGKVWITLEDGKTRPDGNRTQPFQWTVEDLEVLPPNGTFVPHALYSYFGRVMFALDEAYMVPLGEGDQIKTEFTPAAELMAKPGSDEWVNRMARNHKSQSNALYNERQALSNLRTWVDNLGQAILEKAIEHDWCSEYDDFATEWDLPLRKEEFDVTVTLRVEARDADAAERLVSDDLGIGIHMDYVVSGPEISTEGAY